MSSEGAAYSFVTVWRVEAPIARPVFASSHKVVMHAGATGLAGLLHVRVLEGDAETARPQSGG